MWMGFRTTALLLLGLAGAYSIAGDDLPDGAFARLGSDRMRVAINVHGLQFSPDSRWLLAADREQAWIWEPATGKRLFRFSYPRETVVSGSATTEGTVALLCKSNKSLQIRHIDPRNPTESRAIPLSLSIESDSAFDRSGCWLAIANKNRLWMVDALSGKEQWTESLPGPVSESPVFSHDGKHVLICLGDQILRFDRKTGQVKQRFSTTGQKQMLSKMVLSQDGKRLAVMCGRSESQVAVWDTDSAQIVRQYAPAMHPLGFLADQRTLVVAHPNGVAVYDEARGIPVRDMELSPVANLSLSPDGKLLASQANDAILLFDCATGKPMPHSADPPGLASEFQFQSRQQLTGKYTSWGGWVRWDLKTRTSTPIRPPNIADAIPVALSADGRVSLYRTDKGIRLVEVATGQQLLFHEVNLRSDHPAAGLSADGNRVVVAGYDGVTILDRTGTRRQVARNANEHGPAQLFAISRDARWAALESHSPVADRQHLQIIDLEHGQIAVTAQIDGPAYALEFSEDGRRVAVGITRFDQRSDSRYACWVFDLEDRRFVFKSPVEAADRPPLIALSPAGRTLLRLERDGVEAVELATGKTRAKLPGALGAHAMALAMDGRTLVTSVANHGPVILWDLLGKDGQTLKVPESDAEIESFVILLFADDAHLAYRAGRQLAMAGDRSLPALLKRLQPEPEPDASRMQSLIADLDARSFLRRERASRELQSRGELAEPWLRRVLAESTSIEARRRAEMILNATTTPRADRRNPVRGVELLQWIGTADAKRALEHLASGAEGSRITREAKVALQSMSR